MDDLQREAAPPQNAHAWDSARRAREPIAWALLVLIAFVILIGAWQLFGLAGTSIIDPPGGVPLTAFSIRASAVAPQFVTGGVFAVPVLAVILVSFAGGLTRHARQVVQAAIVIQAIALGLGVISWVGALGGHVRPDVWFPVDAAYLDRGRRGGRQHGRQALAGPAAPGPAD
jgi:hypothetical protein